MKNVGSTDKIIRLILAAIVAGLYFGGFISGTIAIVGLVVLAVLVITSLIGYCPAYSIFKINTKK